MIFGYVAQPACTKSLCFEDFLYATDSPENREKSSKFEFENPPPNF